MFGIMYSVIGNQLGDLYPFLNVNPSAMFSHLLTSRSTDSNCVAAASYDLSKDACVSRSDILIVYLHYK